MPENLRALVVAYDFPPHAAIGTMRTLRLVRVLRESGWDVAVLTSAPGTYLPGTPVDPVLETQVPDGVRVERAGVLRGFSAVTSRLRRPHAAAPGRVTASAAPAMARPKQGGFRTAVHRVKDMVDGALEIPDKESGWIVPATLKGLGLLRSHRPDVIYSSAPPWSGQVVAWLLAVASRRPWVADFRDPWARAPGRNWRYAFRQRAATLAERLVVRRAEATLFVTRANRDEYTQIYGPAAARRFHLVPNGCDPGQFEQLGGVPDRLDRFVLLHAGAFYGPRNPAPALEAVGRAVARGALSRHSFRLRLLGDNSHGIELRNMCRRLGIEDVVEFAPRVTRTESLREMRAASALMLVQTGTTVSIPGKAYDYLAAGRPIFALSEEGETADLVRASGIGVSVPPDAPVDAIEAALLQIVALAGRPYAAPPRDLYDGYVHARTAARVLREFATHGRAHAAVADAPTDEVLSGTGQETDR